MAHSMDTSSRFGGQADSVKVPAGRVLAPEEGKRIQVPGGSIVLKTVGTARHISGTCKMGPASDPLTVVDQYGRVHGVENLRVVDGSILPHVTRANTHATIIMVAERIAEWISSASGHSAIA